jgi:hypothetical protein
LSALRAGPFASTTSSGAAAGAAAAAGGTGSSTGRSSAGCGSAAFSSACRRASSSARLAASAASRSARSAATRPSSASPLGPLLGLAGGALARLLVGLAGVVQRLEAGRLFLFGQIGNPRQLRGVLRGVVDLGRLGGDGNSLHALFVDADLLEAPFGILQVGPLLAHLDRHRLGAPREKL